MNTLLHRQRVVRVVMALTLIVGGLMLTACSGEGGFSFDFGQGGEGGGGTSIFSPMLILLLIVFLVAIVAVVALGALGKK